MRTRARPVPHEVRAATHRLHRGEILADQHRTGEAEQRQRHEPGHHPEEQPADDGEEPEDAGQDERAPGEPTRPTRRRARGLAAVPCRGRVVEDARVEDRGEPAQAARHQREGEDHEVDEHDVTPTSTCRNPRASISGERDQHRGGEADHLGGSGRA